MPLYVLAILVVTGVALIVAVVHFAGGSAAVEPIDEQSALDRFALDFPNCEIERVVVSSDREAALLFLKGARETGLVQRMGRRSLTRMLTAEMLKNVDESDAGLRLHLKDFTLPSTELHFFERSEFGNVKKRLEQILENAT